MWLLKLHFQISALCALTIFSVIFLCYRKIAENGWVQGDGGKRGFLARFWELLKAVFYLLLASVIPFFNLASVWGICKMTTQKKEDADNGDAKT